MRIAVAQILAIVAIAGEFAAPAIAQSATEPGTQAATQSDAQTAARTGTQSAAQPAVAGSSSCIECHARFYELWSTSHHGTAMQPYTPDFARENLPAQTEPLRIGDRTYQYQSDKTGGWVTESSTASVKKTTDGAATESAAENANHYPIQHVMGGKNVYYFLTPLSIAAGCKSCRSRTTCASGIGSTRPPAPCGTSRKRPTRRSTGAPAS